MFRSKALRYTIFGVSLLAAGFLAAFLIDSGLATFSSNVRADNSEVTTEKNEQSIVDKINSFIFGDTTIGLTMFRGSPSRNSYGIGPIPVDPKVLWRYPDKPMCSYSEAEGVTKQWCGSGWTGQPVVWERPDGITEVIFGAYDGAVHFVNAKTGTETRPSFQTGDLIKGSVTLDPDGYPLLYFGSRDNNLRILSLDANSNASGNSGAAVELWRLNAGEVKGKWNNDWDGNPVVMNDFLFEGGENSWFFAVKINRSYVDNKVAVAPQIVFKMPVWNDELIQNIGDQMVSIEGSVAFFNDRVYFANSGGRVLGLDISHVADGVAPIVFDYWVGDDVDATIVVDEKGMLYISSELERTKEPAASRSAALGQFIKLDPSKQTITAQTVDADGAITTQTSGDPYVWGVQVPKETFDKGGIWATPAISGNYLYVATHTGKLLTVDKETGIVTNTDYIGEHAWSSPVVAEDASGVKKLLVPTCVTGGFKQYDLTNPAIPKLTNTMPLASGACIESTPAVWKGQIYVGTRDGYFYSFADK